MKLSRKYYLEKNSSSFYNKWNENLLSFFQSRNNVGLPDKTYDFEEISVKARRNKCIIMCFDKNNGNFLKCQAFWNKMYSREDVALMVEETLKFQYDMMKAGYIE